MRIECRSERAGDALLKFEQNIVYSKMHKSNIVSKAIKDIEFIIQIHSKTILSSILRYDYNRYVDNMVFIGIINSTRITVIWWSRKNSIFGILKYRKKY